MNKGFTKLSLVIGAAIVIILGFFLVTNVFATNNLPVEDDCVVVNAPETIQFEKDAKPGSGVVNVTYKWFEGPEGTWTLKVDVDPIGGENHRDWKSSYPNWWFLSKPETLPQTIVEHACPTPTPTIEPTVTPTPTEDPCDPEIYSRVSKVSLQIDYQENPCEEEEPTPTPTPTETPGQPGNPPTFQGSTTDAPGVCKDDSIGTVGGIYVDRGVANDGKLEVRWWPAANADRAHIKYTDGAVGDWRYALLNTENDGVEVIGDLQNGKHYWFIVAGVKGCAVGPWSSAFDPLP